MEISAGLSSRTIPLGTVEETTGTVNLGQQWVAQGDLLPAGHDGRVELGTLRETTAAALGAEAFVDGVGGAAKGTEPGRHVDMRSCVQRLVPHWLLRLCVVRRGIRIRVRIAHGSAGIGIAVAITRPSSSTCYL